jgi:hypothetical protein
MLFIDDCMEAQELLPSTGQGGLKAAALRHDVIKIYPRL